MPNRLQPNHNKIHGPHVKIDGGPFFDLVLLFPLWSHDTMDPEEEFCRKAADLMENNRWIPLLFALATVGLLLFMICNSPFLLDLYTSENREKISSKSSSSQSEPTTSASNPSSSSTASPSKQPSGSDSIPAISDGDGGKEASTSDETTWSDRPAVAQIDLSEGKMIEDVYKRQLFSPCGCHLTSPQKPL